MHLSDLCRSGWMDRSSICLGELWFWSSLRWHVCPSPHMISLHVKLDLTSKAKLLNETCSESPAARLSVTKQGLLGTGRMWEQLICYILPYYLFLAEHTRVEGVVQKKVCVSVRDKASTSRFSLVLKTVTRVKFRTCLSMPTAQQFTQAHSFCSVSF